MAPSVGEWKGFVGAAQESSSPASLVGWARGSRKAGGPRPIHAAFLLANFAQGPASSSPLHPCQPHLDAVHCPCVLVPCLALPNTLLCLKCPQPLTSAC